MSSEFTQARTTESSEEDLKNNRKEDKIQKRKRKASVDAGPPEKKSRSCINTFKSCVPSPVAPRVENKKRKASDDGEAPLKKLRWSDTSDGASSARVEEDWSANDVSQHTNVLTEEEKIYAMSSSANTSRADFVEKYHELKKIGAGGFGSVYAGFRKADNLPVAIKHIPCKGVTYDQVTCNGKVYNVIVEVALMLKAGGLPGSVGQSVVVSLLDWYLLGKELVLVMERPKFSKDLFDYRNENRRSLDEQEAKMILRQLVDAAIDIHSKGVFHQDMKLRNILIEVKSGQPRVRLIDFGCGSFSTAIPFHRFSGTRVYAPPEWFERETYWAESTTVWQLGILFYSLLRGHKPFNTMAFLNNHIHINKALPTEVKMLLNMCLAREPLKRATLEELQLALQLPRAR